MYAFNGTYNIWDNTANTQRFTITSAGNVGIGVTDPLGALEVRGNVHLSASGTGSKYIGFHSADTLSAFIEKSGNDMTFYNVDSGNLKFATSDSEKMRIDSSGNIGIGTTSPNAKLEVTGSSDGDLTSAIFANTVQGGTNDTVAVELQLAGSSGQVAASTLRAGKGEDWTSGTSRSGFLAIEAVLDGTNRQMAYFGSDGDGSSKVSFSTNNSERMRISSAGNIHLQNSDARIQLNSGGAGANSTSNDTVHIRGDGDNMKLMTAANGNYIFENNGSEQFRITSAGIVGINTTSPDSNSKLDVNGNLYATRLYVDAGGNGTDPMIRVSTDTNTGIFFPADDTLAITTGGSERMRIDSSGQVFIGSTASVDAGFLVVKADPSTYNHIVTIPTSNASYNALAMNNSGGTRIGAISVGTGSNSITYGGTSDYRLKENIVPMEKGLERVKKLKPVKFNWKEDGSSSEGFIAHEIQEAGWEVGVEGHKDGEEMQMVEYGKLTPLLVKAIQEQQELIEDLQTQLNNLRGK